MNHPSSLRSGRLLAIAGMLSCCAMEALARTYVHDARLDERHHDLTGPFNYFLSPGDALGFMDAPKAFQLTGDGAFSHPLRSLTKIP